MRCLLGYKPDLHSIASAHRLAMSITGFTRLPIKLSEELLVYQYVQQH